MSSKHVWRVADAGVMLWQPATETTLDLTLQEPLEPWYNLIEDDIQASPGSSYEGDEEAAILPSIEEIFENHIKDGPVQDLHTLCPSSSPTAASDQDNHTPDSSTFSNLFCDTDLYSQLKASTRPLDDQNFAELDSESSVSEFTTSSPCPKQDLVGQVREIPITSHYLEVNLIQNTKPVQRKLDFNMVTFRSTIDGVPEALNNCGRASLVALQKIERDPPHQWHEDERELLTIMYRWYDDTEPTAISKTFNAITGLNLRHRVIRSQFENYILLYGGRAFPEYQRVVAIPFHDPRGRYDEIRNIIDETAVEFGIDLPRRMADVKFNAGQARSAKSPKTRKHYRDLIRRATIKERERARRRPQSIEPQPELESEPELELELPVQACMLGQTTLIRSFGWEDEEAWSDVEDSLNSMSLSPGTPSRSPPGTRYVGFRVWDEDSRTMFSDESGFVSEAFARFWKGEYPPPFSLEGQGLHALMILTNLHLSLSGGASTFVSVSTSLLQALVKASTMKDPRIAIVALDHPLLNKPNKTLYAAEIMQMLKGRGLAWWARYKGIAERLIWASLPTTAVLSYFPLTDLQVLSNSDQACSDMLSLECIQPGKRTSYVASQMKKRNKLLNTTTARAMAAVSRVFGLHRKEVGLAHIQGFTASLVDSFTIQECSATNVHTMSSIASAFALALCSIVHHHQQVMEAFQEGIKQGYHTVNYYSGRGQGQGRRRAGRNT